MIPAVRGQRLAGLPRPLTTGAALLAAGAATGALVGAAAGALRIVYVLPVWPVVGVALAAAAADLCRAVVGRPVPWSARRQAPRAWTRMFPPEGAGALYGARLGLGATTHLASWLWWAWLVAAVAVGPVFGAITGAVFGAGRHAGPLALGAAITTPERAVRLVRTALRIERAVTVSGVLATLALAAALG